MDERDTLLGLSSVYLFGRQLDDLQLATAGYKNGFGGPELGDNRHLRKQLTAGDARFARIFAFSFEGALFELGRPTIFLVHGVGMKLDEPAPRNAVGSVEYGRLSRSPGSSAVSGLGLLSGAFAKDLKVWTYDRGDFSVRLDAETGTLEQILLSAELDDEDFARSSGGRSSGGRSSGGRSSGGRSSGGRSSGVMGRSSGWIPRKG
jgi:uncharacterized membrane protein YgcG